VKLNSQTMNVKIKKKKPRKRSAARVLAGPPRRRRDCLLWVGLFFIFHLFSPSAHFSLLLFLCILDSQPPLASLIIIVPWFVFVCARTDPTAIVPVVKRGRQFWVQREVELRAAHTELAAELERTRSSLVEIEQEREQERKVDNDADSITRNELEVELKRTRLRMEAADRDAAVTARENIVLKGELKVQSFDLATTTKQLDSVSEQLKKSTRGLAAVIRQRSQREAKSTAVEKKLDGIARELEVTRHTADRLERAINLVVEDAMCVVCLASPHFVVLECGCAHICGTCFQSLRRQALETVDVHIQCPACRGVHKIDTPAPVLRAKITGSSLLDSVAVAIKDIP